MFTITYMYTYGMLTVYMQSHLCRGIVRIDPIGTIKSILCKFLKKIALLLHCC